MKDIGKYTLESFPLSRLSTIDIASVGLKKHHIKALIELDVTEARKMILARNKLTENISFNSWLIKCISLAVADSAQIHGISKGKRTVVCFDDIDISILIEREVDGQKVPLPYVIRKTNEKSIAEITDEIKNAKKQSVIDEGHHVLGQKHNNLLMRCYYALPGFIRRMIWNVMLRSPFLTKKNMGTIVITSVGMIGIINGWIIPISVHPLCFAIGSINRKPGVVENRIEIREYLPMTVLIDHDIIDGAPAVRVLLKLNELVESGFGLL